MFARINSTRNLLPTPNRHTVESGQWAANLLATTPETNTTLIDHTMQDALLEWYLQTSTNPNRPYQYRAHCQGPYCYEHCPDSLGPSPHVANSWPLGAKVFIVVVILAMTIICLIMKLAFFIWLRYLERKQDFFLHSLGDNIETGQSLLEVSSMHIEYAGSY